MKRPNIESIVVNTLGIAALVFGVLAILSMIIGELTADSRYAAARARGAAQADAEYAASSSLVQK